MRHWQVPLGMGLHVILAQLQLGTGWHSKLWHWPVQGRHTSKACMHISSLHLGTKGAAEAMATQTGRSGNGTEGSSTGQCKPVMHHTIYSTSQSVDILQVHRAGTRGVLDTPLHTCLPQPAGRPRRQSYAVAMRRGSGPCLRLWHRGMSPSQLFRRQLQWSRRSTGRCACLLQRPACLSTMCVCLPAVCRWGTRDGGCT